MYFIYFISLYFYSYIKKKYKNVCIRTILIFQFSVLWSSFGVAEMGIKILIKIWNKTAVHAALWSGHFYVL